ncbi:MAG: alpha/beta hydrolase [Proteobacteria bacterium]|nr:alpha/beta hydrolase [Pseudomonadota bacterium]
MGTIWGRMTKQKRQKLGGQIFTLTHEGMPIRYGLWRGRLGQHPLIVVLPGFSEFIEKYDHVLARITKQGYDAVIIDWPGQGLSGRFVVDAGGGSAPVHAESFDFHLACLFAVLARVCEKTKQNKQRPLILLGHSMGAHLALRACAVLNEEAKIVRGVVAVAPMIMPPVKPFVPIWLLLLVLWLATRIPALARSRIPWRGQAPRDYEADHGGGRDFTPDNPLTRHPAGFAHHPNMWQKYPATKTYGATFGWAYAAYASCVATTARQKWLGRLTTPILAHLPCDERIVAGAYQGWAARHLPRCRVVAYPHARHELLLELPEVRERVWRETWKFIAGVGR